MLSKQLLSSLIRENMENDNLAEFNRKTIEHTQMEQRSVTTFPIEEHLKFKVSMKENTAETVFVCLCLGLGIADSFYTYDDESRVVIKNLPFHLLLNGRFFERMFLQLEETFSERYNDEKNKQIKDNLKYSYFQFMFEQLKMELEEKGFSKRRMKLFSKLMAFAREFLINGIVDITEEELHLTRLGESIIENIDKIIDFKLQVLDSHYEISDREMKTILLFILNNFINVDYSNDTTYNNYMIARKSVEEQKGFISYNVDKIDSLSKFVNRLLKKKCIYQ